MTLTRWKVMAGFLGVSLGGLAAVAGPAQKPGQTHRLDKPAPLDPPALPSGGSAPAKPTALPAAPPAAPLDVLPPPAGSLPSLPPIGPAAPSVPEAPPTTPAAPKPAPLPEPLPAPAAPKVVEPLPATPTVTPANFAPTTPPPSAPGADPLNVPPPPGLTPPAVVPQSGVEKPLPTGGVGFTVTPAAATVTPAAATVSASKFRIILRVGEGEPMFEVRQGDDLMMKVVCEKVDIKSPEKGTGPSAVIATGKVRFAGFGAEGSCDALSFMAGTGEVAMTGVVKVQVKDKLGRVESELTAEKLQYRLDAGALPGGVRP